MPAIRSRVLSPAQAERLQACARVLDPPARIVMTGAWRPRRRAIRAGRGEGVEVLIVDQGAIARVDGPIDVLFIGPAARYSVALDLSSAGRGASCRAGRCSSTARSPRRR